MTSRYTVASNVTEAMLYFEVKWDILVLWGAEFISGYFAAKV